jgi:hypothetical protein
MTGMGETQREILLDNPSNLQNWIRTKTAEAGLHRSFNALPEDDAKDASVVLFVLSQCTGATADGHGHPCLILNKRSAQVRQAGDLCCPGGGVSWPKDRYLGRLLRLPGCPMWRWPRSKQGGLTMNPANRTLPILLAAGLREAWEEMHLNPLRFLFLGVLPEQHLVMFKRVIYPIVGWAAPQRLKPNWEVERIVPIPLRLLLDPAHYGRFRPLLTSTDTGDTQPLRSEDFPCFIHEDGQGREMLWGATYRITQYFLQLIFDFEAPRTDDLPVVHRHLDETYLNGSRWRARTSRSNDEKDW